MDRKEEEDERYDRIDRKELEMILYCMKDLFVNERNVFTIIFEKTSPILIRNSDYFFSLFGL